MLASILFIVGVPLVSVFAIGTIGSAIKRRRATKKTDTTEKDGAVEEEPVKKQKMTREKGSDVEEERVKKQKMTREKAIEKWEDLDPILGNHELVLRDNGVIELTAKNGEKYELIEYRRWNNHGALPMRIWFRQEGHSADKCDLSGWEGKLYRTFKAY